MIQVSYTVDFFYIGSTQKSYKIRKNELCGELRTLFNMAQSKSIKGLSNITFKNI